jgi:hypothetical protein
MFAKLSIAIALTLAVSACGGGDSEPAGPFPVTISWTPNREIGVNRPGGGYEVTLAGQPAIDVPYVSGPSGPTSVTVSLLPGTHTVRVRAYAAFDAQGSTTRTFSAPQELRFNFR